MTKDSERSLVDSFNVLVVKIAHCWEQSTLRRVRRAFFGWKGAVVRRESVKRMTQ